MFIATNCYFSHLTGFGASKVDKFDDAFRVNHDVGSFNVSVDNAVAVEIAECRSDLSGEVRNGTTTQTAKPAEEREVRVDIWWAQASHMSSM